MAWRQPDDKPLSEPMMVSLQTHICGLNELMYLNDSVKGCYNTNFGVQDIDHVIVVML